MISTTLDIQRRLYHDSGFFCNSEIDNLTLSELYYLILSSPTKEEGGDDGSEYEGNSK